MGHEIWGVLAQHAGQWVAVDKKGKVVETAGTLDDLRTRIDGRSAGLTVVFAAGR